MQEGAHFEEGADYPSAGQPKSPKRPRRRKVFNAQHAHLSSRKAIELPGHVQEP